ncbi:glycosyltransferase [Gryllotalpicola protaetiae]|uniref:D-inositol 3-phosphate glycosyltransferase n=1 Tax=Gryllotalpicola protaetiae TaxID=2419771 RepID=A0A387BTA7_9MICO|nr:glycosyltransferase [Gryllotalpicola protaetiae]
MANHVLVYATRADAPIRGADLEGFSTVIELPRGHARRVLTIRKMIKRFSDVTVHAHSSLGGLYARFAMPKSTSRRIVYTPHCYAFERADLPALVRALYWSAEWILSFNTTVFAACSPREAELSSWLGSRGRVEYVPNIYPRDSILELHEGPRRSGPRLRLVGAGRIAAQKDPGFFAASVEALRRKGFNVEARWIGDGPPVWRKELEGAGVDILGWLDREDVFTALAESDIYIHSAAWEGFPIGLLEADAAGLPVIVRSAAWNRGLRIPNAIVQPTDIVGCVRKLMSSSDRLVALERQRNIFAGHTADKLRVALARVYETERFQLRHDRPSLEPVDEAAGSPLA